MQSRVVVAFLDEIYMYKESICTKKISQEGLLKLNIRSNNIES